MMLTNNWRIQGRREGRKEGRKEGRVEGQKLRRDLLLDMVERRLQRSLTGDEVLRFDLLVMRRGGAKKIANAIIDLDPMDLARLFVNP